MRNSVSTPAFDPQAVAGRTGGAVDRFDFVDALPGLVPHPRPRRVPLGAPLVVAGWAVDPTAFAPARAVCVVLDSVRPHPAATGISRGDAAAERDEPTPDAVGFRAVVPTADLLPGAHEVRAFALAADDRWYEAGHRDFWLSPNPLRELPATPRRLRPRIDQVVDLDEDGVMMGAASPVPCGRFALITGYAVDPHTRRGVAGAAAVDARGRLWSAPCDVLRADLRGLVDALDDRLGFEVLVPADALGRGRHTLAVRVFDAGGRFFEGEAEVTLDVAGPLRRFPAFAQLRSAPAPAAAALRVLDADGRPGPRIPLAAGGSVALARGTVVVVEGWALAADGTGAEAVYAELVSPGVDVPPQRFTALAGFERDHPPRELPAPPVPDGWFSARLDTAFVPPRTYALGLAAADADRRRYARRELGSVTVVAASDGGGTGSARRT